MKSQVRPFAKMDEALSGLQILSEPQRRGTPLPLGQLVEESRSRANIPNHLLDSKIYSKLKSNSLIQAEPPELHFSGFALGKEYIKNLKLINISSEVMNIHIISTQTKHFQTTYTKKYRLIPGLAYTVKVRFCPDEWRYFQDCILVHCKGEENLLIPVHAYPVIDDLHIPPHIDLPAVPLGQSINHAIPVRCSSPIDFEFQVNVIQPHEAFSVHPLAGVIPANGEAKIMVTFSPFQYETSQITIQLVISQFNSKPHLCTITGNSTPHLSISQLEGKPVHGEARSAECTGSPSATLVPHRSKTKRRSTRQAEKSKILRDQPGLKPLVDVCTHAGVAKMLIKDTSKISSKALRQAMSCDTMVGVQTRQMKEALFIKKVQQNVKEEQATHNKWKVQLGKDPMSEQARRQILEERENALHEYKVRRGDLRKEEDFAAGPPKLSSVRVVREARQAPEGAPSFQFYSSFQLELKQRALRQFQQAARKVVIQCRMRRRLTLLKKLADTVRNPAKAQKAVEERVCDLKITPDKVFPSSFPFFAEDDDPLAEPSLVTMPVDPIDVTVTTQIPFFKLEVPQRYKLMGYQPVSTWEAFNSYVPPTLARPLRTGSADDLVPDEAKAQSPGTVELKAVEKKELENEKESVQTSMTAGLTFTAPEALLRPFPANPLRIFNPAPGLQAYKPTPKYLESDLEFHLCPVPKYKMPEPSTSDIKTQTPHAQKKLSDSKEVIKGFMTWKDFDSLTLNYLSNQPSPTSHFALRRCDDYNTDMLPLTAPPPLIALPDDMASLIDKACDGSGIQLIPEMIRAEFLPAQTHTEKATLQLKELQSKESPEVNAMGKRVMMKLKELEVTDQP